MVQLMAILVALATPGLPDQPVQASAGLHPTFVLTASEVEDCIRQGETMAKKGRSYTDLMAKYREQPTWFRGKRGGVHESAVWCETLDGAPILVDAFIAASRYTASRIPAAIRSEGWVAGFVDFDVLLTSAAIVQQRWMPYRGVVPTGIRNADAEDVEVTRFVLSDDREHHFEATMDTPVGKDSSGTSSFSGVLAMPNFTNTNTRVRVSSTSTGPEGTTYGTATGYGQSQSVSYSYVPWSAERPYYQKRYRVRFSLFNDDGTPRIGPDVKAITLHIITVNGEQRVSYRLPKPKKR